MLQVKINGKIHEINYRDQVVKIDGVTVKVDGSMVKVGSKSYEVFSPEEYDETWKLAVNF